MDPFWLTFTDAELEQRYRLHLANRQSSPMDMWYWCWGVAIRVASVARFGGCLRLLACWPCILYLVWMEVELLIRRSADAERRIRWRTNLVVASRLLHCLEIGMGAVDYVYAFTIFCYDGIPTHPLLLGLSFYMAHGICAMLCLGLFLPLIFRLHFPLQLGAAVFLLSIIGPELCLQTGGGAVPGTGWLFEVLDALALWEARIVVGAFTGTEISWKVQFPCLHMAMFAQFYIGFGVLSYLVWRFERNSRVAFVQEMPLEERQNTSVKRLHWSISVAHFAVFLLAFGILWTTLLVMAPNIMGWRMRNSGHQSCSVAF